MRLRWHRATSSRSEAASSNDDGGGEGAEYLDSMVRPDDDDGRDATAWRRAHHWSPDTGTK